MQPPEPEWMSFIQTTPMPGWDWWDSSTLLLKAVAGGLIGLIIRWLYKKFGSAISNREAFSSLFPLLIVATVIVIHVVKSSLALSLGLVGALSIVRFRAAIKEPEELVYLFFCIAIGLALGADLPLVSAVALVGFTIFVLLRHRYTRSHQYSSLLLTVTGEAPYFFDNGRGGVQSVIEELSGGKKIQRIDLEDNQVQMRLIVSPEEAKDIVRLVQQLRQRLPGCQVSFVDLDTLL